MASIYDRQVKAKAEEIKTFIEETCDLNGIAIDEIDISTSWPNGTVTVYLEEDSPYNQGQVCGAVRSHFSGIEYEYEDNDMIIFTFRIRS